MHLLASLFLSLIAAAAPEQPRTPPLTVHLTDRTGAAISNATLEALANDTTVQAQATTDATGKATLPLDPGTYRIRAHAKGFVDRTSAPVDASATLSLPLFPENTLAARVTGPEKAPVEGARVCATLRDASSFPEHALARQILDKGRVCARTDEKGAVSWPLPFGTYDLRVEADGLVPRVAVIDLARTTPEQRFALEKGGSIVGRLVDAESHGVPKAGVRLRHREREISAEAQSDAEGKFKTSGLAPGHWLVEIDPPDGAVILKDGIELAPGATVDLGVLTVRGGAAISGTVIDPEGKPVAATIRAHEAGGIMRLLRKVKADAEGRFRVPGFQDDEEITLVVEPAEGLAPKLVEDLVPPVSNLKVRLDETGNVCGVVRVARGALPEGIRISAQSRPETARLLGTFLQARTDEIDAETGAFCIDDVVPAEEVKLTATAPGYWAEPATASVESGREAGPVELTLQRGLTLHGTVTDLEGEPLAEAAVHAGDTRMVFTDGEGEFLLDGLRPGMNRLAVRRAGFAPAGRSVLLPLADDERLVIELGRGGSVEGSVLHADKRPAEGVSLRIEDQGASDTVTDAEGRYRIDGVGAGEQVVVRGVKGGYDDFEKRVVEIAEGASVTADFVIGGEIEGLVLRGGIPVPGAMIALGRPADWADLGSHGAQRTFSDGAGQYRLAGVRPGWNSVTVRDGEQRIVFPIEIPAGERPHVDLTLPDRLVRGRVLSAADDSPLEGASVSSNLAGWPGPTGSSSSSFYSMWGNDGEGVEYALTSQARVSTNADSRGEFALFIESANEPTVSASAREYDFAVLRVPRNAPEALVFRLTRNVTVRVLVQDPAGRTLQEVTVCFLSGDGRSRTCSNNAASPLEQSLKEGSYTILATAAGFGTAVDSREILAREDGQPVEVVLPLAPGAPAVIRLVGQAAPGARVPSLVDPSGADRTLLVRERETDPANGDARWPTWPLEAGTWQVTVDLGDGTPLQKDLTIAPGVGQEIAFP